MAPSTHVLDLACGQGRHTRFLASLGHKVTAVDRDASALTGLTDVATTLCMDLEQDAWPLQGQQFNAVVVTNYLWRPQFDNVLALLAPDGVLIYETFAQDHATIGRPARAEFLLASGELLQRCAALKVVAYEDGFDAAGPRFVQRIAAVKPNAIAAAEPRRYTL